MPRRPRIFVEGGIYHVDNRFARGAEIFRDENEAERFRELLRVVTRRDGLTVFAWVLMSTHAHMALRSGPAPLSRALGFVQARFSQQYNRVHRSTGPLWQSRYKAKRVDNDDDVSQLIAYIHLNPVSARIVDDPAAYRYSGHRELLSNDGVCGPQTSPPSFLGATTSSHDGSAGARFDGWRMKRSAPCTMRWIMR